MHLHWAISQIDDGYLEKGKEARESERGKEKKYSSRLKERGEEKASV